MKGCLFIMINNINDLAKKFGMNVEQFERSIYKYTACGAWIKWTDKKVLLGSIVEGSDAEITAPPLKFPFTMDEFEKTLQFVEDEADMLWHEANDLTCSGCGFVVDEDGICPNCGLEIDIE
jgi:hypothetical protein